MSPRKKLLLGLLTAAAFFGALEVVLRLRERLLAGRWVIDQRYTQHYNHRDWPIYEPHPYLGRALKPGATMAYRQRVHSFADDDFRVYVDATVRINRLGFRGREIDRAKPPGSTRIVCLGGSTVFGIGSITSDARTWPAELEALLDLLDPTGGYQVINAGVAGYNSAEILIHLALRVLDLKPDLVIIYAATNDIAAAAQPGFRRDFSHYRRRNLPEPDPLVEQLERSFLFLKLRQVAVDRLRHAPSEPAGGHFAPDGLEVYRRNMRGIVALARAHGARVLVAAQSLSFDAATPPQEARRRGANQLDGLGVKLLDVHLAYNGAALDLARELGLPHIDTQTLLPKDPRYFTDKVHFTDAGNRALAELLEPAVRAALAP